jgi:hypothetical protein
MSRADFGALERFAMVTALEAILPFAIFQLDCKRKHRDCKSHDTHVAAAHLTTTDGPRERAFREVLLWNLKLFREETPDRDFLNRRSRIKQL